MRTARWMLIVIEVSEINRLQDLDAVCDDWQRLLAQTPNYSFFQTLPWLAACWEGHAGPQRLRVLLVQRDDELIGIVPWCVRTERRRVGPLRVLTYPLDDWGTFYGPLGPEPRVAIRAALRHIASTPRDWDLIDLRWVDEAADEFLAIGEGFREADLSYRARPRMEVRMCRFTIGWDAYVRSRSRNWRRKMHHDLDSLAAAGDVELLRYRPHAGTGTAAEHARFFALCEQIAAKSWQAADASQSTLSSPRVHEMLLRAHLAAAELGMLDTNILLIGGRPAAFNYNYVAEGRTYGLRCGYDPTLGLESCGRVLLYKMLEDSFRRGDVEYNFGPGRQHYKTRFATEMRFAYTFRHYARYSLRSQLLHWKEEVAARLSSAEAFIDQNLVD